MSVWEISQGTDQRIHTAAMEGNLQMLIKCMEEGENLNAVGRNGNTPLHYAASAGHNAVVKYLIKHVTSVDTPNIYGETPILMAVYSKQVDTIDMLIGAGANTNWQDGIGPTICWTKQAKDCSGDTPWNIYIWKYPERYMDVKTAKIKQSIKLKLAFNSTAASDMVGYEHFQGECLQELEKAKKLKVYENFTILDVFLKHNEPYYCANSELLKTLEETLNTPLFIEGHPIYGYMFRLVLKNSKIRYIFLYSALESLKRDTRIKFVRELDDLVKQQILAYLNNDHLKCLIESV